MKVEQAVRAAIHEGQELSTPSRQSPFWVERLDHRGVVLLLGRQQTPTLLTWECWEGTVPFIRQRGGEVEIGGRYDVGGNRGTLDEWTKTCINRGTAGWVAAVLAHAGVVEIVGSRPQRVRLRPSWR
jgi:hypothetical protein